MADELKLTAEQRRKLRDIRDDLARRVIKTRADLAVARLDLARGLRSELPDRSQIEGQIDALATLQASLMKSAASARLEARKVLTPEQRRQLEEMRFRGGARSEEGRRGQGRWRSEGNGRGSANERGTPRDPGGDTE